MKKILVLGGTGFIGQAIQAARPTWQWTSIGRQTIDFTDTAAVDQAIRSQSHFDVVINAAGFYGGLPFNQRYNAEIFYQNSIINANICRLVRSIQPAKFINIGSACVYPKNSQQILNEAQIGCGTPHDSVIYSAKSKMHMLDLMSTIGVPWEFLIVGNVYGPGEHLDDEKSHVVGGLISKIKRADQTLNVIGTGAAVRDFIYVSDMAEIVCRYAHRNEATNSVSNISSGHATSINDVVETLVSVSEKHLTVSWGSPDQDGILFKVLDNTKMKFDTGYQPKITLAEGLNATWQWAQHQGTP
jgi:GDP-L-fucose synthase